MAVQRAPLKTRFWLGVGDEETEVDESLEYEAVIGLAVSPLPARRYSLKFWT
jgi:hypothetical protein